MTGHWLRRVAFVLLLSVVALAALTAKMLVQGERAMRLSDETFNRGELRESVRHARRAATLYAPGAPHVGAAYERLAAVAVGAESAGDSDVARSAWNAIRAAALETEHLWLPRSIELERANRNLARLSVASVPEERRASEKRAAAELLAQRQSPRSGWIALLSAGLLLALAGLGAVAAWAVDPAGRIRPRRAGWGTALLVIGVACWTIAVFQA